MAITHKLSVMITGLENNSENGNRQLDIGGRSKLNRVKNQMKQ